MATIKISDSPHPKDELSQYASATSSAVDHPNTIYHKYNHNLPGDDIYNIRERPGPRLSSDHNISRTNTHDARDDEDPGLRRPGDYKDKQVFTGRLLAWLAYQSIGAIYGDIGTSPLYVYSSTFTAPPSKADLVGVLSIIIWSLFMMVTVKYILIILRADNYGEGGTFSTYSLLSRYMNITRRDPREASLVRMERHLTGELNPAGRKVRRGLESSNFFRNFMKVIGILAVTMVISDGLLTPAQSVLGAVQGIEVVQPTISKGTIIGVTDAILIFLFAIQPLGIERMSYGFAPVIIVWLGLNAVFGVYNLVNYDASVFKAFNPAEAFLYLARHKEDGWRSLGGILLAFTGVEALFADLGAFSRRAIQLSWLCYTLPCLLLAYIGQAAFISVHPEAYSNPFFNSAPPGTVYPALIIAILAAIVASQAIITATFQLLAQVMKLSYFPQIKIVHTSKTFHGQLYAPMANWLLMIGTILVASIYNNTTSLGNAYGVCVMFVTFFDTCMVSLAAMMVWRVNPFFVLPVWLVFASLDGAFLSSVLTKVPSGAWFTLTLAAVLACIFLLWRYGKEQQWAAEAEDRYPTSHFVRTKGDEQICLSDHFSGSSLSTIKGFGIYFDKAGETTPTVFSQFVLKLTAIPEVTVFFHLRPLETPTVPAEDRHTVSRLAIPNCYRLVVRYGFNDEVISPDLAMIVANQVRKYLQAEQSHQRIIAKGPKGYEEDSQELSTSGDHSSNDQLEGQEAQPEPRPFQEKKEKRLTREQTEKQLQNLEEAFSHNVLYIVGKEQMKIKKGTNFIRATILWIFLWIRDNSRNKIANLRLPADKLVEVGFLKEI